MKFQRPRDCNNCHVTMENVTSYALKESRDDMSRLRLATKSRITSHDIQEQCYSGLVLIQMFTD